MDEPTEPKLMGNGDFGDVDDIMCVFCSGMLTFADNAVVHTTPPCREFILSNNALDFVKRCNDAVRKIYGIERGPSN